MTDDGIEGIQKEIVGWSLDFPRDGGSAGLGRVSPRGTRSGTVRFILCNVIVYGAAWGNPKIRRDSHQIGQLRSASFRLFFLFPDEGLYYDLNLE